MDLITRATRVTAADFFTTPPDSTGQVAAVAGFMKGAKIGCARLARKAQGEVADLKTSLDYVSKLIEVNPDIDAAELAKDLTHRFRGKPNTRSE